MVAIVAPNMAMVTRQRNTRPFVLKFQFVCLFGIESTSVLYSLVGFIFWKV